LATPEKIHYWYPSGKNPSDAHSFGLLSMYLFWTCLLSTVCLFNPLFDINLLAVCSSHSSSKSHLTSLFYAYFALRAPRLWQLGQRYVPMASLPLGMLCFLSRPGLM